MPETPPTAPRLQLAQLLRDLRTARGYGVNQAAAGLRCTADTVRRVERGGTKITYQMFFMMLSLYKVDDQDQRAMLEELWDQSDQPRWWSKYRLPESTGRMIGFEMAAQTILTLEIMVVSGLLQTEAYARALLKGCEPQADDERIERWVQLRTERQQWMRESKAQPKMVFVLEESAVRRPVGGTDVMLEQLDHLLRRPFGCTILVVPATVGGYPGCNGAFSIFEFDPKVRRPALYVEGPAGNLYRDEAEAVESARVKFERTRDAALPERASRRLISAVMEELQG
jgi:transcriptional regulator with XRE-family HTH domain